VPGLRRHRRAGVVSSNCIAEITNGRDFLPIKVTGMSPPLRIARFACDTAWHELIVGGERWQMPCLMPNRKSQIAWLVGYQGIGAFSHGYKRWTGFNAKKMREKLIASH
jgi:hypothetical protein